MSQSRRTALRQMVGSSGVLLGLSMQKLFANESAKPTGLGLVIYDCAIRRKWMLQRDAKADLFEPLTFLKHCQSIGAGGMQAALGVLNADRVRALRAFSEATAFVHRSHRQSAEGQSRPWTLRGGDSHGGRGWRVSGAHRHHAGTSLRTVQVAGRVQRV